MMRRESVCYIVEIELGLASAETGEAVGNGRLLRSRSRGGKSVE